MTVPVVRLSKYRDCNSVVLVDSVTVVRLMKPKPAVGCSYLTMACFPSYLLRDIHPRNTSTVVYFQMYGITLLVFLHFVICLLMLFVALLMRLL